MNIIELINDIGLTIIIIKNRLPWFTKRIKACKKKNYISNSWQIKIIKILKIIKNTRINLL